MPSDKRLIAINLPQFHPFKENDEWWGKGFTEWTNVVKARPRFKGHYQPHLPADTGFYDLRLPEAREMQAEMARKYGIYGFCYYHYWFNGKQLMERPVNEILKSGKPNFPFMLCWANENWTRAWDGGEKEVLIEQKYSKEDDIAHMEYLCENVFKDPRYIRIQDKPFFTVYRPDLFPNIKETITTWREIAKKYNLDLYLGFMRTEAKTRETILDSGFDIAVDFQPHIHSKEKWWFDINAWIDAFREKILRKKEFIMPIMYNYKDYIKMAYSSFFSKSLKEFPGITPSWDNSPRRIGRSFYGLKNSTPELYGEWLQFLLKNFKPYSKEENFIFINAWNEWAEGNHLEPDEKWGLAYLEETKKKLELCNNIK
jgi:lipopolysaccharide biosynthesis protein